MSTGSVFINNRTQAVRLPADSRFPDDVKKVLVRVVGQERILSPVGHTWDSFFLADDLQVSEDFMEERASQEQQERESF